MTSIASSLALLAASARGARPPRARPRLDDRLGHLHRALRPVRRAGRARRAVRACLWLRRLDLEDFALQHHRQLWAAIGEIEEDNLGAGRLEQVNRGLDPGHDLADLDLPRLLADRLIVEAAHSVLLNRLTPLLEPSDVQRLSLAQPELQLRGAAASLERQRTLKRCRHLLDAWGSQRLATLEQCIAQLLVDPTPAGPLLDMEGRIEELFQALNADALRFQEAYYSERRYLEALDQRRRAGYEEIVATPAA